MCSTFSSAVKCPSRGKSWMSVLFTCSGLPAPASQTATSEMPKVMLSKSVVQMWSATVKMTLFLYISLTFFSHSDFLQPHSLMSVLAAGLRASATIIVHSRGLSHQLLVRQSALSRYLRQCWGWCTVSQEQRLSLKISGARSIRRSVFFWFPFFTFILSSKRCR